jgi:hypothetical protein
LGLPAGGEPRCPQSHDFIPFDLPVSCGLLAGQKILMLATEPLIWGPLLGMSFYDPTYSGNPNETSKTGVRTIMCKLVTASVRAGGSAAVVSVGALEDFHSACRSLHLLLGGSLKSEARRGDQGLALVSVERRCCAGYRRLPAFLVDLRGHATGKFVMIVRNLVNARLSLGWWPPVGRKWALHWRASWRCRWRLAGVRSPSANRYR